jgi:V-type H+-transporting ATPase subunit a
VSDGCGLQVWFIKVRKIKAIYHTLNYFNLDTSQKCLIAGET